MKKTVYSTLKLLTFLTKYGKFLTSHSTIAIYGLCSSCVNAKRKASLKAQLIAKEKNLENKKKILNNKKK